MSVFSCDTGSIFVGKHDHFFDMRLDMLEALLAAPVVHGAKWQQLDVSQSDQHATHELINVTFWYNMPERMQTAQQFIMPDLPWSEDHFQERVGGEPVNPGATHRNWPYHAGQVDLHQRSGKYDHNYMERYWAKKLKVERSSSTLGENWPFLGYRFPVGDLGDVVQQLIVDDTTRQAYLPVWFPEDTGAIMSQRVPCSLGYHFLIRDDHLHIMYFIRSCEVLRHFTNDVYMTVRLAQWVRDKVDRTLAIGQLTMHVGSLHAFVGDVERIEKDLM